MKLEKFQYLASSTVKGEEVKYIREAQVWVGVHFAASQKRAFEMACEHKAHGVIPSRISSEVRAPKTNTIEGFRVESWRIDDCHTAREKKEIADRLDRAGSFDGAKSAAANEVYNHKRELKLKAKRGGSVAKLEVVKGVAK